MKVTNKDIQWLDSYCPNLQYEEKAQKISGELDFCAYYDKETGKLIIGNGEKNQGQNTFIRDVFEIEVRLDSDSRDQNGWPKVYEIGGRHHEIAKKCKVEVIDLHFFSLDGACCLGIKCTPDRKLGVRTLITNLIIPFFYRLSYTEKFGITATRSALWDEYSHGDEGLIEYKRDIINMSKLDLGRNESCPCRSGMKYKKCHLDEVERMNRLHN